MGKSKYASTIKESALECIEDRNFKTALSWYLDLLRITEKITWEVKDHQGLPWWHESKKHNGLEY